MPWAYCCNQAGTFVLFCPTFVTWVGGEPWKRKSSALATLLLLRSTLHILLGRFRFHKLLTLPHRFGSVLTHVLSQFLKPSSPGFIRAIAEQANRMCIHYPFPIGELRRNIVGSPVSWPFGMALKSRVELRHPDLISIRFPIHSA